MDKVVTFLETLIPKGETLGSRKLLTLSKKDFRKFIELDPEHDSSLANYTKGGTYSNSEGLVVALVPSNASTSTKLHELGHVELGHRGYKTLAEYLVHEVEAEDYQSSRRDKALSYDTLYRIASSAGTQFPESSPAKIADMLLAVLEEELGLNKAEHKELWSEFRHYAYRGIKEGSKKRR